MVWGNMGTLSGGGIVMGARSWGHAWSSKGWESLKGVGAIWVCSTCELMGQDDIPSRGGWCERDGSVGVWVGRDHGDGGLRMGGPGTGCWDGIDYAYGMGAQNVRSGSCGHAWRRWGKGGRA